MMGPVDDPIGSHVWLVLASFAGALAALSVRPFKNMSALEISLSLMVSASFPIFVGPWAASVYFGAGPVDLRVLGAIYWIMACGSNILIPLLIKHFGRVFGARTNGNEEPKQ
jgi:hypothetical protein